ncbi:hypothetical protein [Clostridium baratii]|uniref:hypothetical protein n=1 Tax=Clostridium baratii TaxID=1561 RepID=UPI0030D06020
MENKKELIKKVQFDFLRAGQVGCVHVEADCKTVEDLKEALEFAKEASKLIPPISKHEETKECIDAYLKV